MRHNSTTLYEVLTMLAVAFIGTARIEATDHYVSPAGSDTNNGTSASTPWRTITKVNAGVYNGGDSVLFESGQVFTGALVMVSTNWGSAPVPSAAQPVTFGSYGAERATISSDTAAGWSSTDIGAFVVRDLIFVGGGTSNTTANGLWIYSTLAPDTHLPAFRLTNLDISEYGACGVFSWGDNTGAGWDNILISDCTIHDCTAGVLWSAAGIQIIGANFGAGWTRPAYLNPIVTGNHVHNNPGKANCTGATSGTGIVLGQCCGGAIQYNDVHDNGANNNHYPGAQNIWIHDSVDLLVQYNESYRARAAARDGANSAAGISMDVHCKNCTAQYNYCHDNEGPGIQIMSYSEGVTPFRTNEGTTIRYNVTENNGTEDNYPSEILLISCGGFAPSVLADVNIHNNTCYSSGRPCLLFSHADFSNTTGRVCNNIFYATEGARFVDCLYDALPPDTNQFLMAGNVYYTTGAFSLRWGTTSYSTLTSWLSASGQETVGDDNTALTCNPILNNPGAGGTLGDPDRLHTLSAYQLRGTSPLIDRGLNLDALFGVDIGTNDFYGTSLPQCRTYDVGAHESPDTDEDGIPDDWEQFYFGTTNVANSSSHSDTDGSSDRDEFEAGTNPTNTLSCLSLTDLVPGSTTNIVLTWSSAEGRRYAILDSTNLVSGITNRCAAGILATPPLNVHTCGVDTTPARFFRVQIER